MLHNSTSLSAKHLTPSVLTIPLVLLVAFAALVIVSGNITPLIPFLLIVTIVLGVGILTLRPNPISISFLFLLLIYPAIPAAVGMPDYRNWFALAWVVGVFGLFYLEGCNINWQYRWIKTPYSFIYIAYAIIVILSTFSNPTSSFALSAIIQTTTLVLVYWVFAQLLTRQNINKVMIVLLIGAIINSLLFTAAFLESSFQTTLAGFVYGVQRPEVWGVKANAWPYPSMIGWAILLSIIVHGSIKRRDWLWIVPAAMLLMGTVVINMSRSIILGIFVSSIFILLTHSKARRFLFISTGAAFAGMVAALPLIWPKLEGILRLKAGLTGRGEIWRMAWGIISDNPFLGIGPANYRARFVFEAPYMENGAILMIDQPSTHNIYLHVAAEVGIIGACISIGLMIFFFIRSRRIWAHLKSTPYFFSLVALVAIMVAAVMRSLFETELALQHGNLGENLIILVITALQDQLSARASRSP